MTILNLSVVKLHKEPKKKHNYIGHDLLRGYTGQGTGTLIRAMLDGRITKVRTPPLLMDLFHDHWPKIQ